MELKLQYDHDIRLPVAAALLRGNSTAEWLKQVSSWHIDVASISCYILPESISSLKPAGLFVIFNTPSIVKDIELIQPYACIGKRLYVPVNSKLVPQTTDAELNALLLWNLQVFHPVIGLVGFEENTAVNINDLFSYPLIKTADWSFANRGLHDKPELEKVIVTPISPETMIDEIQKQIGQKQIEDIIPPDEKTHPVFKKFLILLNLILLLPIWLILKIIEFFSKPFNNDNGHNYSNKTGLFQQLQSWITKNMDELQKKRDSELKRLSDLFDKDTGEALQYAIPLNSPYLDRGKSTASYWLLGRRLTKFDLGNLGGGSVVDAWDVSSYYQELRTKYLKAAEKEIEQKDFKKAVYVYAHLLGDYNNAAKILEQGDYYREAAALYQTHLKNIPAAAQCLERGGLYTEAIDLYKDLKEDEKVGDLYMKISQETKALQHYESSVSRKIESENLIDAARIVREKMMHEERAKELLLQGWEGNYQHEPCLKKYFEIIIESDNSEIETTVNRIYKEHTTERKHLPFLNVLEYVNYKTENEQVLYNNQEIAYEILHKEAINGNIQNLHRLKRFLPGNRLIGSDTSRFVSSNVSSQLTDNIVRHIQLDQSIRWKKACWHRNQFIAVGMKNQQLHMVRANWYGNTEYHSWENSIADNSRLNFIFSPYHSNTIILHSTNDISVSNRNLLKNKYFNDTLLVRQLIWMHKEPMLFRIDANENINRLEMNRGDFTLQHYTMDGVLIGIINCELLSGSVVGASYPNNPALFYNDGYYYTYDSISFLTISPGGGIIATDLATGIRMAGVSEHAHDFYIIISTNKGCFICKPFKGELNFTGHFFAKELIPVQIVFISVHRFVIAEKMKALVFELSGSEPSLLYEVKTNSEIAGILPSAQRNSFAILEEDGKVTVHELIA